MTVFLPSTHSFLLHILTFLWMKINTNSFRKPQKHFHCSKTNPSISILCFAVVSSRYHFQLKPYNPDHKAPGSKDLVYLEPSPGFCTKNARLGIQGTSGRQCNDTSIGVDGCDLMCCGRGYRTQEVIVVERCSCTFHWCCEVKCKLCRTKKTIHTCL